MKEQIYKITISDIRLEATLFDEAFHLKPSNIQGGIMSHIRRMHRHTSHEIFFVLDGALHVHTASESSFSAQTAVVIPPLCDHYTVSDGTNGYCLYFSVEHIPNGAETLFRSVQEKLTDATATFKLDEDTVFYVTRLANAVQTENAAEQIPHLLYLIFDSLFKQTITAESKEASKTCKRDTYIHSIELYVNNCEGKVSLQKLADKLYLCPKQVSRIIKKEYGCSLTDMVNRRKLTAACTLLKHTALSVTEISRAVGYEYENYFFTLFKKSLGVTPLQYRKQFKAVKK